MIPYEPTKIEIPFAYEGARNEIPTEGGEETGNASMKSGFPPITSQPLSQGGIPPQRKDFNGILYLLSAYAYYAQAGGLYAWDSEIDYAVNCVVTYGNNIYICIANNGASTSAGVVEPGSDEAYWLELFVYLLRASGGNVGSAVNPMYIANGQFVASTANVGGDAQPVRMNNGVIEALSATVGAEDVPVFLKNGILTACTSSGAIFKEAKLSTTGYVVFNNGLVLEWARTAKSSGSKYYTYTKQISYNTYIAIATDRSSGSTAGSLPITWFTGSTTTTTDRFWMDDSAGNNITIFIIGYQSS